MLKQHAGLPSHAEHLNELALGLHAGSALAEAEQVLCIIQLPACAVAQMLSRQPTSRSDSRKASGHGVPQDVLAALDAPPHPRLQLPLSLERSQRPYRH